MTRIVSSIHTKWQPAVDPQQIYTIIPLQKHLGELDMTGIRTPVEITQIRKFEKQICEYSVNVYALDEIQAKSRDNEVIMIPPQHERKKQKISRQSRHFRRETSRHVTILYHVVIKNVSRLLKGRTAGDHTMFVCKFCLYSLEKEHSIIAHEVSCSEHAAVTAKYPAEPMNILRFNNFGHTLETPFVIYADSESI